MRKIAIIGCGGSGKSTLARRLGQRLGMPVHHLDSLFWKPGWVETPRAEWGAIQEKLCDQEAWVIDGNYGGTMDIRLRASDTVIFLDLPTSVCLLGAIQRFLRHRGRVRPDMAPGCPERLGFEYFLWIWRYRKDRRPKVLQRLEQLKAQKQVIVLRSRRSIRDFVEAADYTNESE